MQFKNPVGVLKILVSFPVGRRVQCIDNGDEILGYFSSTGTDFWPFFFPVGRRGSNECVTWGCYRRSKSHFLYNHYKMVDAGSQRITQYFDYWIYTFPIPNGKWKMGSASQITRITYGQFNTTKMLDAFLRYLLNVYKWNRRL